MLLIFKGPDAYVSSSWYSFPEIPTWDYEAVHIHARITLQTAQELQTSLERLLAFFEKDSEYPVSYATIPAEIWEENFKEITGFWLTPFQAVGIEKLHQGFKKKEVQNISKALQRGKGCPKNAELAERLKIKHNIT